MSLQVGPIMHICLVGNNRAGVQVIDPSLRATGSRECAPDDKLREAIQLPLRNKKAGLLRRVAPRNDG
jgi:hypothetical protein